MRGLCVSCDLLDRKTPLIRPIGHLLPSREKGLGRYFAKVLAISPFSVLKHKLRGIHHGPGNVFNHLTTVGPFGRQQVVHNFLLIIRWTSPNTRAYSSSAISSPDFELSTRAFVVPLSFAMSRKICSEFIKCRLCTTVESLTPFARRILIRVWSAERVQEQRIASMSPQLLGR